MLLRRALPSCLVLALALVTVSRAAPSLPPTADGLPDIQGTWIGPAHLKVASLDGSFKDAKVKTTYTFTLTQTGADLAGQIQADFAGNPVEVDVTGKIGNGRFWLQGDVVGQPSVVIGRVLGKAPHRKLKCFGSEGDPNKTVIGSIVLAEQP